MKPMSPLALRIVGMACTIIVGNHLCDASSSSGDDKVINRTEQLKKVINSNNRGANVKDGDVSLEDDGSIGTIYLSSAENASSSETSSATGSSSSSSSSSSSDHISTANNMNQHGSSDHTTTYYYNNDPNNDSQRVNAKYDDEQTYLDLFGERAKELLTQHIIPSTDAECRWDWRMGRCEPYCSCGLQFLYGDYHIGRSCRFRPHPPPSQSSGGGDASVEISKEQTEETSWQEAWQEAWHSQIKEGSADDASNFVPPLFTKSQQNVLPETSSWDRTNATCTLPPESRYIQVIHQLTNALTHSTAVVDNFHKLKNATANAANTTVVHSRHYWKTGRQKACETVKRKVEERAQIRNQPVVLTKHGATWIRRVCGTGDGSVRSEDGDGIVDDSGEVDEDMDAVDVADEVEEGTAQDDLQ